MSRLEALARRLVIVWGLAVAGCQGGAAPSAEPPPGAAEPPATRAELEAGIARDLARLRALETIEVGQLVLAFPAQDAACYGRPCPGAPWTAAVEAEVRRQAPRLARLTDLAEESAGGAAPFEPSPAAIEPDLEALRTLAIVEVGDLLAVAPADNPRCYDLPCPEDLGRADAENRRRAGVVHDLALRTAADAP